MFVEIILNKNNKMNKFASLFYNNVTTLFVIH